MIKDCLLVFALVMSFWLYTVDNGQINTLKASTGEQTNKLVSQTKQINDLKEQVTELQNKPAINIVPTKHDAETDDRTEVLTVSTNSGIVHVKENSVFNPSSIQQVNPTNFDVNGVRIAFGSSYMKVYNTESLYELQKRTSSTQELHQTLDGTLYIVARGSDYGFITQVIAPNITYTVTFLTAMPDDYVKYVLQATDYYVEEASTNE